MDDQHDYDIHEDLTHLEDPEPISNEETDVSTSHIAELLAANASLYRLSLNYSNETLTGIYESPDIQAGTMVMAETRYGKDLVKVTGKLTHQDGIHLQDIVKIYAVANEADLARAAQDQKKEEEAFYICREKIYAHKLDMKLVSVHYLLEEPKILFFFTAENRVDFRELVKDLVTIFKTRIELRQIGVRDESRIVGGLGVCGRALCCHSVSDKLKPVSIKMAKDQNLSLNSMKISGPCGRLLCCLSYEHSFYQEARRSMPTEGSKIQYEGGMWKVTEVNPVLNRVRLHGEDNKTMELQANRFERVENRWKIVPPPQEETTPVTEQEK